MSIKTYTFNTIITDLVHNIRTNEAKREKLQKRLDCIVQLYNRSEALKNVLEPHRDIIDEAMKLPLVPSPVTEYNFDRLPTYRRNKKGKVIFDSSTSQEILAIKQHYERYVTDWFCLNDSTYDKTCAIFKGLVKKLRKKLTLNFIPKFKGSMAIKKKLSKIDKNYINSFMKNSDNDTTILLDPKSSNYQKDFNELSDAVYKYLKKWVKKNKSYFDEEIEFMTNVIGKYFSDEGVAFGSVPVRNFDYVKSSRHEKDRVLKMEKISSIRVQRNFIHIEKSGVKFELIRLKLPFIMGHTVLMAEILDISILHADCEQAWTEFYHK